MIYPVSEHAVQKLTESDINCNEKSYFWAVLNTCYSAASRETERFISVFNVVYTILESCSYVPVQSKGKDCRKWRELRDKTSPVAQK